MPFNDDAVGKARDLAKIGKAYRLPNSRPAGRQRPAAKLKNGVSSADTDEEQKEIEVAILGAMALRGAT